IENGEREPLLFKGGENLGELRHLVRRERVHCGRIGIAVVTPCSEGPLWVEVESNHLFARFHGSDGNGGGEGGFSCAALLGDKSKCSHESTIASRHDRAIAAKC